MKDITIRNAKESDHIKIISVIEDWWSGRDLSYMIPKLFLIHFANSSFIAEKDNMMVGFLIGFMSQTDTNQAYIHFAGVDPKFRSQGLGNKLYSVFFDISIKNNRSVVRSCTSPVNKGSIAFHKRLGFSLLESKDMMDNIPVFLDYNMKNDPKVLFTKDLL